MKSKSRDIFISYSSHDKAVAEKIAEWLKSEGLEVWYDKWEILVGHDIVDKVYTGIRDSRFLLVLLSEKSVKSKWVQQEINAAKLTEIESGYTVVLPAIIDEKAKPLIPEALKTKRYANLAANFESAMSEIVRAVSAYKRGTDFVAAPEKPLETPSRSTTSPVAEDSQFFPLDQFFSEPEEDLIDPYLHTRLASSDGSQFLPLDEFLPDPVHDPVREGAAAISRRALNDYSRPPHVTQHDNTRDAFLEMRQRMTKLLNDPNHRKVPLSGFISVLSPEYRDEAMRGITEALDAGRSEEDIIESIVMGMNDV